MRRDFIFAAIHYGKKQKTQLSKSEKLMSRTWRANVSKLFRRFNSYELSRPTTCLSRLRPLDVPLNAARLSRVSTRRTRFCVCASMRSSFAMSWSRRVIVWAYNVIAVGCGIGRAGRISVGGEGEEDEGDVESGLVRIVRLLRVMSKSVSCAMSKITPSKCLIYATKYTIKQKIQE